MPCLHLSLPTDTRAARAALGAGALAWALAAVANPTMPVTQAAPDPELLVRARAWLAAVHQVNPSEILVQPLDPRLQVNNCAAGWAFDKPFAQNEGVVRARCQDTQWQLFLSVTLPRGARPTPLAPGLPNASARSAAPPKNPLAAPIGAQGSAQIAATAPVAYPTTTWTPGGSPAQTVQAVPPAVRRGNTVLTVWAPAPGLAVTARLEALDDGRLGETIRLRNRDTGRILSAQVSGPNQALGQ